MYENACTGSDNALADNVFVARQPIFDQREQVVGYELLYRGSLDNKSGVDAECNGDSATNSMLDNSLNLLGLTSLTGGKRAFINFTRQLLLDEVYTVLPREQVVIELLESVDPDPEVVDACIKLKTAGYTLALDDFVFNRSYRPLVELADVLKVDFLTTGPSERWAIAERFNADVQLLAEKVENDEDVRQARELGYSLFQGYFYCKPQIISGRKIPASKRNYLRFLHEVNQPEVSFERLAALIKQEVSLSMKLLRYLNSAAVGLREKVTSIKHALVLMGVRPLRKWASLAALAEACDNRPAELIITSLIRARFCETVGQHAPRRASELDLFLTGLLSTIDAMLGCDMHEALVDLSEPQDVVAALRGESIPLRAVLDLVVAYERADWPRVQSLTAQLQITGTQTTRAYHDATRWADRVCAA